MEGMVQGPGCGTPWGSGPSVSRRAPAAAGAALWGGWAGAPVLLSVWCAPPGEARLARVRNSLVVVFSLLC